MEESTKMTPVDFGPGNVYEAVMIIAKHAKRKSMATQQAFHEKVTAFAPVTATLEEPSEGEEREQEKISKWYELQPKAVVVATKEFLANKVVYRYPEATTPTAVAKKTTASTKKK